MVIPGGFGERSFGDAVGGRSGVKEHQRQLIEQLSFYELTLSVSVAELCNHIAEQRVPEQICSALGNSTEPSLCLPARVVRLAAAVRARQIRSRPRQGLAPIPTGASHWSCPQVTRASPRDFSHPIGVGTAARHRQTTVRSRRAKLPQCGAGDRRYPTPTCTSRCRSVRT